VTVELYECVRAAALHRPCVGGGMTEMVVSLAISRDSTDAGSVEIAQ